MSVGLPKVTPAGPDCSVQSCERLPPGGRALSVTVPVSVAVFVGRVMVWLLGLMVTTAGWAGEITVTEMVVQALSCELFRLQLHQDSSYTPHVSGHGRWRDGSTLERGGPCSPLGGLRVAENGKSGVNEMAISLV